MHYYNSMGNIELPESPRKLIPREKGRCNELFASGIS
jgi:hypothetical protein